MTRRLRPRYYILDEENHPVATDMLTWGRFFEDFNNRVVGYTEITSELYVSTVFLGIDHRHSFMGDGPPILFETMIFGADDDETYCRRYATWDDAKTGHDVIVRKLRTAQRERKTVKP